jgi:hypothetical protein
LPQAVAFIRKPSGQGISLFRRDVVFGGRPGIQVGLERLASEETEGDDES